MINYRRKKGGGKKRSHASFFKRKKFLFYRWVTDFSSETDENKKKTSPKVDCRACTQKFINLGAQQKKKRSHHRIQQELVIMRCWQRRVRDHELLTASTHTHTHTQKYRRKVLLSRTYPVSERRPLDAWSRRRRLVIGLFFVACGLSRRCVIAPDRHLNYQQNGSSKVQWRWRNCEPKSININK